MVVFEIQISEDKFSNQQQKTGASKKTTLRKKSPEYRINPFDK